MSRGWNQVNTAPRIIVSYLGGVSFRVTGIPDNVELHQIPKCGRPGNNPARPMDDQGAAKHVGNS